MTNKTMAQELIQWELETHDQAIATLERKLEAAHEARREFINRHNLNKPVKGKQS